MIQALVVAAFVGGAAIAQSVDPAMKFDAADVYVTPHSDTNFSLFMRGPLVRQNRMEIRAANLVELINAAYDVDVDKIVGGPNWLEFDRYDVIAKLPAGSTPESRKQMLQTLLAERFQLTTHKDARPYPVYVLTAGKNGHLKVSDGSSEQNGCRRQAPAQPPQPGSVVQAEFSCRSMTMSAFAEQLRFMGGYLQREVVDSTGLKDAYDFDFKWTPRAQLASAGPDGITLTDAVDRLGLKLELKPLPRPVLVVDGAIEKPTSNQANIAEILPDVSVPTEFEVADIKLTPLDYRGGQFQMLPSGQVNIRGYPMKAVIESAFQVYSDDMIVGAPKWLDDARIDVTAKAPQAAMIEVEGERQGNGPPSRPGLDYDDVMMMVKNLLVERFKLKTHFEERPVNAYNLTAAKPRMKAADSAGRTRCYEGPGPDGKDPRTANPMLTRLITCENMTMGRFAGMLQDLAGGYIHAPVADNTGLDGAYDFGLAFSTAGQVRAGSAGRGADSATGSGTLASDRNGALSLLDAMQKQLGLKLESARRPSQVLVIDHLEEKPIEK